MRRAGRASNCSIGRSVTAAALIRGPNSFGGCNMKSGLTFLFCTLCCAASTLASPRPQSSTPPAASQDKTPPSYDMKAQAILDLQQMQQKFTGLAGAVPQEKYTWRPGDGARTFGELFLHTAAAGFNFPTMKGAPAAPDFTAKGFEKSTT